MSIRNFDAFFSPASVALIGASRKEHSVGAVVARNLLGGGFKGEIYLVNPHAEDISGQRVYADVAALPRVPDLAIITTPAPAVPDAIAQLAAKGARAAVVITAGFGSHDADGPALRQRMLDAARPATLRIMGPNCLGLLVPTIGLNGSFAPVQPRAGGIGFAAQSGAMITAVLDWADGRGIGFSSLASLGDMADADFGDLLDYYANDTATTGVLLYIEHVTQARKFMSAARRVARLKPVVVIKAGRHEEGQRAAASHTGALAGSDAVYDAAFRRAGMLRVTTLTDLFDAVELLSTQQRVSGDRLAILTNGGGAGVLATDTLVDEGGRLATLAPETIAALGAVLPRTWSQANPVDIIGDADGARYGAATAAVLADPNADAVLVLNCPTAVADSQEGARAVARITAAQNPQTRKPVFTVWLGREGATPARSVFKEARLPTFETPDEGVRAFMHLARHAKAQALLMEAPEPPEPVGHEARLQARSAITAARLGGRTLLTEIEAKRVLAAYRIPIVEARAARTPAAAGQVALALGLPAAIKILSPDITHKTDVGGVALNLNTEVDVEVAAERMLARVAKAVPQARIEGFSVQRMASKPGAHELICGIADDRTFGPVIMFGQGGTSVEVVRDKALMLPPLNDALVRDMIERTRVARLLKGYRDRRPADMDAIVGVLLRLAELSADIPEIAELDINPLWADAEGVLALDARITLRPEHDGDHRRFAILPYPQALESGLTTRSGGVYQVRPIRPHDENHLQAMIAASVPDDIRMRFLGALRALPRQLAQRLTQIDYDREMVFVAAPADAPDHLAGVVRLACDPDFERGEYSVFVRSDLKGRGLGYALMQAIITYAKTRGLKEIFGDELAENERMLTMTREFGFTTAGKAGEPGIVEVTLKL